MNNYNFEFRTQVEVPAWETQMRPTDGFVFLGSCFAQTVGQRFESYGLQAISNPLGVIYNPESVAIQIHHAFHQEEDLPIFPTEDEWRCWIAGTKISGATEEQCREVMQGALGILATTIQQSDYLFITLGSNVCYRLKSNGLLVCNCHRAPQTQFDEDCLTLEQCKLSLCQIVDEVRMCNPSIKVIFTVSPYRYVKYGMHGSQLVKATLLLAVDDVCRMYPDTVQYFPAYEIVMDELRDYRFYSDDMIHPSQMAVEYIWSRLIENCADEQMKSYLSEYEPVRKFFMHRPMYPESPKYKSLLAHIEKQQNDVKQKYNV